MLMKNVVNTTLDENRPCGSGARKADFPRQFTPDAKSGLAGLPPVQWSWASLKLNLEWPALQEDFGPSPLSSCGVEIVRGENAGTHGSLMAAENRRLPNRPAAFLEHDSSDDAVPVCTEWGDRSVGKVAFHPPVQDEVKR